jgi:hypothetical protein
MDQATASVSSELHAAWKAELQATYGNLAEFNARLAAGDISVLYDPDDAYVQIWVGPREPSAVLEVDDALWLLVAPDAPLILGLEIPNIEVFVQAYPSHGARLMRTIEQLNPAHGQWVSLSPATNAAVVAELRHLLPA